ncbi:MAG TPA: RluA family pseudouridine synthase [Thermoanaerobaculia bacterium]|nr:RluA family pseudouridine synthase [Thermoanaerobaculia bacterium]
MHILYEDEALLFINKPPGLVVQRSYDMDEPVLVELVAEYTSPSFLMQRLDRGTSGVMFFSKRADINAKLTRQFEQKRIRKRYLALCEGELGEAQTIDAPLARIGPISFGVRDGGKRAITRVEPLPTAHCQPPTASLVAVGLQTGRTHQIRVHLGAIGHPLVGDWLYGQRNAARPMLHAEELEMTHPLSNQPIRVAAPLPDDFREEALRRGIVIARGQSDRCGVQLTD